MSQMSTPLKIFLGIVGFIVIMSLGLCSSAQAQVTMGDKLRVRDAKEAPWQEGLLVRRDTATLTLNQAGMDRVYELMEIEKVDWYKPKNIGLELFLGAGAGALGFWLGASGLCDESTHDCMEDGTAVAIGAGAGAAVGALIYAIAPGRWTNVTGDFLPAGGP